MKKHNHDDGFASSSALLDKGAEVFTKKMFKHSQLKTQERWSDIEQRRREKLFTRAKFRRAEFDLG